MREVSIQPFSPVANHCKCESFHDFVFKKMLFCNGLIDSTGLLCAEFSCTIWRFECSDNLYLYAQYITQYVTQSHNSAMLFWVIQSPVHFRFPTLEFWTPITQTHVKKVFCRCLLTHTELCIENRTFRLDRNSCFKRTCKSNSVQNRVRKNAFLHLSKWGNYWSVNKNGGFGPAKFTKKYPPK